MGIYVSATFADMHGAQKGADTLKDLASNGSLRLHCIAVTTRDAGGSIRTRVILHEEWSLAVTAAFLFGVAGMAVAPLAAAVLAIGGAVFGLAAELTHRGARSAFIHGVTKDLSPSVVALCVEFSGGDLGKVESSIQAAGGTLIKIRNGRSPG